ncbi:hypothetical protein DB346_21550 [Verrucomicrobia bacterium LW23]|nr:hypothetical protein DB346_21550 [Verrucomicrobia bacterium LW23]
MSLPISDHVSSENAHQWQGAARSLALQVNANWWLSTFLPILVGSSIAFAVLILMGRKQGVDLQLLWGVYLGMLVLGSAAAVYLSRAKFISADTAMVRLEAVLGLKNRLSSAAAGIGAWPAVPENREGCYAAHWREITWPVLVSALIIGAALWVPMSRTRPAIATPQERPPAVQELQTQLDELARQEVVQEQAIQDAQRALSDLADRPKDEWYDHSKLEAVDALAKMTNDALNQLNNKVQEAQKAFEQMADAPQGTPDEKLQDLQKQLEKAVNDMNSGAMPAHPKVAEQFNGMDPGKVRNLTPEQIKQLKEKMKEASDKLKQACKDGKDGQPGNGEGDGPGMSKQAQNADQQGNRQKRPGQGQKGGDQPGQDGMGQDQGQEGGQGGVNRGPGAVPLSFYDDEQRPGEARAEKAEGLDINNLEMNDKQGEAKRAHNVDKNAYRGPESSGSSNNTGAGGDIVWRSSLTPDEDEVLRRFYK